MLQDLITTNNIELNKIESNNSMSYIRERAVEYNLFNELEAAKEALEIIKILQI
jgi:hypothetical protein